jgi:glycine cleavage system H protein
MDIPKELLYTDDHEWARIEGTEATIGITAFAVGQLGDITLVELPEVGDEVVAKETMGTVESVKAVSDLFAPLTGSVLAINEALEDEPELVNDEPFGRGWMIKIALKEPGQKDGLLGPEAYAKHCEEGDAD